MLLCPGPGKAADAIQLALVTPTTIASAASTNAVKLIFKPLGFTTNSLSLTASQASVRPGLAVVHLRSLADDFSTNKSVRVVLQKKPEADDWFFEQGGDGSFGIAGIQAGYGRICDADSILLRGRNGTAWEDSSYIFFKKVVRF